ncbi:MAG: adenosylcobinamide-GDP ribazoletransferase [Lachnospiraceae bacterium]|nr:adenosylcobinamide-GDP ribazoletransferase [Lachnospiraceae bacterium]
MRIIRSFLIAISMYSKIPAPRCEWKDEDMKYVFCFFPLIGVVIGGLVYAWTFFCNRFELTELLRVCITAAIPVIVTGGIHVDGFMDTMDAFHSYRDREKKLEILKDPHIGAFSVIMLALYGLVFAGSLSLINRFDSIIIFCLVFVLSRCLSGFLAINFKSAKEGTLNYFSKNSSKVLVSIVVIIEAIICLAGMGLINIFLMIAVLISALITIIYYCLKTKKEFGGVTGDTAGYFLLILERNALIAIVLVKFLMELLVKAEVFA